MTLHVNVTYSACCFKGHPSSFRYWFRPGFVQPVCVCVTVDIHLGFLTFPCLAFHSVPSWFSFSDCFICEFLLFHDPLTLSFHSVLGSLLTSLSLLHGCFICWWPISVYSSGWYLQLVYQVFPSRGLRNFIHFLVYYYPTSTYFIFLCFIISMLKSWSHLWYISPLFLISISQHYSLG